MDNTTNILLPMDPESVLQQAGDMLSAADSFRTVCETLSSTFLSIGTALRDADNSDLPQQVLDCGDRYNELATKSYAIFEDFATRMQNWANTTIGFQEETATKINELGNALNDITSLLSSL